MAGSEALFMQVLERSGDAAENTNSDGLRWSVSPKLFQRI
jgi:hypothetical protein